MYQRHRNWSCIQNFILGIHIKLGLLLDNPILRAFALEWRKPLPTDHLEQPMPILTRVITIITSATFVLFHTKDGHRPIVQILIVQTFIRNRWFEKIILREKARPFQK